MASRSRRRNCPNSITQHKRKSVVATWSGHVAGSEANTAVKPTTERQTKHMKAKVQDTEHGYIKACGMAVDYDTVLTREQPAPNKAQHSQLIERNLGDDGALVGSPHESPDTTSGQAKPCALPWLVCDEQILTDTLNDYGNFNVCIIRRYGEITPQDKANLNLIVRAVNHADKLAEALRVAKDVLAERGIELKEITRALHNYGSEVQP